MSGTVLAAVLLGALLHAGWNVMVKAGQDKALDNALISLVAALLAIPVVALVGWAPAAAWPWLLGSATLHIGYYLTLSRAYEHGEMGLTYPLMRGVAPLLVALAAAATLGETLSPRAWGGMLAVCLGVLALGLSREALASPRAIGFALANAVLIAGYTLVDAAGVRAAGDAPRYVATFFLLNGWGFTALVVWRRGARAAGAHARARIGVALGGACATMGSYGLALWAMTQAPVALVAALRETSVLFAALLGTWLLKEGFSLRRGLGTAVILAGVVVLRLG